MGEAKNKTASIESVTTHPPRGKVIAMVAPAGSAGGRAHRSNRTGRRPGGSGTRDDILQAARKLFAERGYAGATIRAIAQEAGVDGALIHHFFASKEGVFAAAIEDTFAPSEMLPPVLQAGIEGMGERLVRTFLNKWEEPTTDQQLLAVLRSAVSNEEAAQLLRNFLTQELLGRIGQALKGDDAELRATLIGAQLVGVAFLRYVMGYGPIAHMPTESLVHLLSPTIQRYLTEPLAAPPATTRPARAKQPASGARPVRSSAVKPVKKAPQK
ncbi:TetR family transcriptional regulator [Jatrophihabitans sp.]|jgi:AcrR family transcriptional regulator|uniref:TetR/AcrR family transcriptional regulator n=1 Tax=Jatrophihabitans sp. TaxID=1932789 RepID=UPI002EFDBC0F